jgi:4-hydroxy-4-methyl-2-oxoglutarate aldolase
MTDAIRKKLETCYSGVVHDVMRAMGLRNFTLPPHITPLMPEKTLCGPAFTIEGRPDDAADDHETLLAWTGLLSQAPDGHVWVCQPHNHDFALMGELSAETLKTKGVLGCVIDGHARDTNFLINIDFQTWRIGHTPKDIVGRWLPTATNVPIQIADVRIEPGDYLLGDRDGLIVVPKSQAEEIADKSAATMKTENNVRTAILNGTNPQDAYLQHGKF